MKIKELDLSNNNSNSELRAGKLPGCVEYDVENKCLKVYCHDGTTIRVKRLGLEGKKSDMSAADFNNGFLKKVNQSQRYFT